MTDKKTFILIDHQRLTNAGLYLESLPADGSWEAVFKKITKDKTLKQLGALFGVWVKFLSDHHGESEDDIHKRLKAMFLARIYTIEPMTDEQEQWVELLVLYQEAGETDKLLKHSRRISLSWAKLPQMKEYMNAIEKHYQADGCPLPEIDKFYKHYRKDCP